MKVDKFKIMLKCPESQTLIFAQEDFALRWHQRWALRGHLSICKACSTTEKNVDTLRKQLQRWRREGSEA